MIKHNLVKVPGLKAFLFVFMAFMMLIPFSKKADACGCGCTASQSAATKAFIVARHNETRLFITEQFRMHENWFFGSNNFFAGSHDSFFELHVLPALMMMTEQLVTTGMEQMFVLGTFFDARIQLQTQQLLQKREAEAQKDYHPGFDMCVMGTTAQGLAVADRNGEFTSFVLSQRSQDRQLGMFSANGAMNAGIEREGRIRQVKAEYCDPRDNSGDLGLLCSSGKANAATINKDTDYTRTIDGVRTLNIDFADNIITKDEQNVMALASNLFSTDVLDKGFRTPLSHETSEGAYLEMRSLLAKRSVVENSFNAIVGMKVSGPDDSGTAPPTIEFTKNVLGQLGVTSDDDKRRLLGGTLDDGLAPGLRPSYFALMEVLAQKIYLDAEFFTNLYDKPANVQRKEVAMQAINLMLERDMHKSELRSEMVLSVWLELELMKYQKSVQNRLNSLEEKHLQN